MKQFETKGGGYQGVILQVRRPVPGGHRSGQTEGIANSYT